MYSTLFPWQPQQQRASGTFIYNYFFNSLMVPHMVSTHFIYYYIYLCERGESPIKINIRQKCLLSSWKWWMCAAVSKFGSEEVNVWGYLCSFSNNMLSWKWCHTNSYQFSSPWTVSKFEEYLKLFDVIYTIYVQLSWRWFNMHAYHK